MKQTHSVTLSLVVSLSALLACGAAPEGADEPSDGELGSSEQSLIFVIRPPVIVKPIVIAPVNPIADLTLDGVMRYYGGGTPTLGLQINVTNIGDSPATGVSGTVSINGSNFSGALHPYFNGTPTTPNTVKPGEHGYIKVEVPASLMAPCTSYTVKIDLGHTMQGGSSAVFNNDTAIVTTVCRLTWTTPIEAKHLGPSKWEVYTDNGRERTGLDVIEWVKRGVELGAGEVLITAIDLEGTRKGFDLDLFRMVSEAVPVPVIASGGMGTLEHFMQAAQRGRADAVAMADVLHYSRLSLADIRKAAHDGGLPVRKFQA